MEPAVLGIPILFGPYNFSFKETVDGLLAANAGVMVHDVADLGRALGRLLDSEEERRRMGARARDVILSHQGATNRNYALLLPLLKTEGRRLPASDFDRTMPRAASDLDSR